MTWAASRFGGIWIAFFAGTSKALAFEDSVPLSNQMGRWTVFARQSNHFPLPGSPTDCQDGPHRRQPTCFFACVGSGANMAFLDAVKKIENTRMSGCRKARRMFLRAVFLSQATSSFFDCNGITCAPSIWMFSPDNKNRPLAETGASGEAMASLRRKAGQSAGQSLRSAG